MNWKQSLLKLARDREISKGLRCPKCGQKHLTTVKAKKDPLSGLFIPFFGIAAFGSQDQRDLKVCQDCGFDWRQ